MQDLCARPQLIETNFDQILNKVISLHIYLCTFYLFYSLSYFSLLFFFIIFLPWYLSLGLSLEILQIPYV